MRTDSGDCKGNSVLSDDFARSGKWLKKNSFVHEDKTQVTLSCKFYRKIYYLTKEFHVKLHANKPGDGARGIHETGYKFSLNRIALFLSLILQHILHTDHINRGRVPVTNVLKNTSEYHLLDIVLLMFYCLFNK